MVEIERKWLLKKDFKLNSLLWTGKSDIKDWYFNPKIRVRNKDDKWVLTIKSEGTIEREEREYLLNIDDFTFENTRTFLEKIRLTIPYKNQNFEVNIFKQIKYKDKPLIIIELELQDKYQQVDLPEWVGEEVTFDDRFYGHQLFNFLKFKEFSICEDVE